MTVGVGLTPQSRRGPTARRAGRALHLSIMHRAASTPCCRPRLTSNVRQHRKSRLQLQQEVRLRRELEQPQRGKAANIHAALPDLKRMRQEAKLKDKQSRSLVLHCQL